MPPRMTTGIIRAGKALVPRLAASQEKLSGAGSTLMFLYRAISTRLSAHRRKMRIRPGTTVARKHFSTDWRVTQA